MTAPWNADDENPAHEADASGYGDDFDPTGDAPDEGEGFGPMVGDEDGALVTRLFEALFLASEKHRAHAHLSVDATEAWLIEVASRGVMRAPRERVVQIWLPLLERSDHLIERIEADIVGEGRFDESLLGPEAVDLLGMIRRHFESRHGVDLSRDALALSRIGDAARECARTLETEASALLQVTHVLESPNGPLHLAAQLARTPGGATLREWFDEPIGGLSPMRDPELGPPEIWERLPSDRDKSVLSAVVQQFLVETAIDLRRHPEALARVARAVSRANEEVDRQGSRRVELNLPFLVMGRQGPVRLRMRIVPPAGKPTTPPKTPTVAPIPPPADPSIPEALPTDDSLPMTMAVVLLAFGAIVAQLFDGCG
jgi:hypothetical protein